jgi:hypothetical protein
MYIEYMYMCKAGGFRQSTDLARAHIRTADPSLHKV